MKRWYLIIFILIILIILFISIFPFNKNKSDLVSTKDITEKMDGLIITYKDGSYVNDSLTYGNIIKKNIIIENNSNKEQIISLTLKDTLITSERLVYQIKNNNQELHDFKPFNKDSILISNLIIESNSELSLEIIIKSLDETKSNIKFTFDLIGSINSKQEFINLINDTHYKILTKIKSLNGINESGVYTDLIYNYNDSLNGYVIINAKDISAIEYRYYIYNDKYLFNGFINDIDKSITKYNNEKITREEACHLLTKKGCKELSSVKYLEYGGEENFIKDTKEVISLIEKDFVNKEKKIYVYDVTKDIVNKTRVRGYILIDNTKETTYYLYLTNNLFMISGYNYTKYGEYQEGSSTIRAYVESSFNLSSSSPKLVCEFTKFSNCVDKDGKLIS